MCDYKILAHNEDGYIILCNNCNHYQLAFGTTAVTFDPANFKRFRRQLENFKPTDELKGFEKQKRISLDIFTSNSMMVLSYSEFLKLSGLINESAFNQEFEDLFRDLNVNRE